MLPHAWPVLQYSPRLTQELVSGKSNDTTSAHYCRTSFGIISASVVFQRFIEELFAGYPCVIIVDDLLVWGEGTPEHDGN